MKTLSKIWKEDLNKQGKTFGGDTCKLTNKRKNVEVIKLDIDDLKARYAKS